MTSTVIYEGNLRTTCTHLFSNNSIITDAPKDNRGNGAAFSPTDLTATSLATCMLTTMGIYALDNNINIDGARAQVTKIMASSPRRISEVQVKLFFPNSNLLHEEVREKLEHIAHTCPVALSLHVDLKQTVSFQYE
jgi:putative redox protein